MILCETEWYNNFLFAVEPQKTSFRAIDPLEDDDLGFDPGADEDDDDLDFDPGADEEDENFDDEMNDEDDLHEIRVGDDLGEPDPEDDDHLPEDDFQ
ncbi:hypothetical protein MUY27_17225 [Mucilaginibacter sp. RS28]|uniref:Uncharacterized protein n=1 Tax=Mucilaginibacter straminoryzae TaxID=2932774 RepID=A0A9X1X5K6_9SPHI|nr:hypothetical protein [Mucilaginibacter straminoryzae]MCJ8211464.1 hypothetical protein [Mucilaginibacter straminoryzae]